MTSRLWLLTNVLLAVFFARARARAGGCLCVFVSVCYECGVDGGGGGRYDVLCMPPSFPYGGMENPCLTFVTPTLLAGDRSLADVVIHEIAHSWTGNLVTNESWKHFWLNEGTHTGSERGREKESVCVVCMCV